MAITGLDYFMNYFSEHKDKFVLIGGCACFVNLDAQGLPFRATKDLDIVLLIDGENAHPHFVQLFWEFIRRGGYQAKLQSSGRPVYYRFEKPDNEDFPVMLELFSRRLDLLELHGNTVCLPIPANDEISSLSAIILDDEYYALVRNNRKVINGCAVVSHDCLVMLKIKAFLDLSARKSAGENIDSDKIKKHRNDVFRLSQLFTEDNRCMLSPRLQEDLKTFIESVKRAPLNMKSLGLGNMVLAEILDTMKAAYEIQDFE